jgi:hypothetical protein
VRHTTELAKLIDNLLSNLDPFLTYMDDAVIASAVSENVARTCANPLYHAIPLPVISPSDIDVQATCIEYSISLAYHSFLGEWGDTYQTGACCKCS